MLIIFFQEEKLEDDSLPVHVATDSRKYRLDADAFTVTQLQLSLLICSRKLPWIPESHYKWWLLCWSEY